MTASSVFLAHDAAYLLTDMAILSPTRPGVLSKLASKVVSSERLRIAAAICGDTMIEWEDKLVSPLGDVGDLFEASATQQQVLQELPRALEETDRMLSVITRGSGSFRLIVALWSEDGPQGYFACGSVKCLPGVQPFALVRIQDEFVFPDVELQLASDRLATDSSEAVAMIEAQRRKRWTEGSCSGHFTIGGEGHLTRVDRHRITTETIVTWPDRIGRKI